ELCHRHALDDRPDAPFRRRDQSGDPGVGRPHRMPCPQLVGRRRGAAERRGGGPPMTASPLASPATAGDMPSLDVLDRIQRRLLWLAVRMVDVANRVGDSEIKIGGHQASSASMTSIMTALWFCHLSGTDKVAVKP